VRVYVRAHPTGAAALVRLILWAHREHFRAWERVLNGLIRSWEQPIPPGSSSPSAGRRDPARSHHEGTVQAPPGDCSQGITTSRGTIVAPAATPASVCGRPC
jgi:hypothetical protein